MHVAGECRLVVLQSTWMSLDVLKDAVLLRQILFFDFLGDALGSQAEICKAEQSNGHPGKTHETATAAANPVISSSLPSPPLDFTAAIRSACARFASARGLPLAVTIPRRVRRTRVGREPAALGRTWAVAAATIVVRGARRPRSDPRGQACRAAARLRRRCQDQERQVVPDTGLAWGSACYHVPTCMSRFPIAALHVIVWSFTALLDGKFPTRDPDGEE